MNKQYKDKDMEFMELALKRAIKEEYTNKESISIFGLIFLLDIILFFYGAFTSRWIPMIGALSFLIILIWSYNK